MNAATSNSVQNKIKHRNSEQSHRPSHHSQQTPPESVRWMVTFLILLVRFIFVPVSMYNTFLNLFIIVSLLLVASTTDFAVTRILFLIVIFTTFEPAQYGEHEEQTKGSLLIPKSKSLSSSRP
ncbi:MAG: hypothetical protein OWR52_14105 [Acidibacillus sp.]|nr:hypothetical protein [Acidibacillus sp.]